jgi:predicted enzyme related to lactoylglutathione lyase
MPERTKYAPGTPSWVDLQTSDPTTAKSFYRALFGWEYDDQPVGHDADGNESVYSMATKNGKHVAAIAPLPMPGVPPHWNTYVTVEDVDATAAQVPGAGGSVMMGPFDVMDAGRMAVIADPTGAMLCLWQATNHIGASLVNEHGTLSWEEVMTPDIPAATAFYAKIFGWEAAPVDMPGMEYTELKLSGRGVGGAMKPPMEGMPAMWGIYFAVDDTDKAAEIATANGGTVLQPPMDIPPGRMAVIADPAGAMFNVIKLANPGD